MIRRPPRSTHCISSAASDVYKRQVSTQSTGVSNKMSADKAKEKSEFVEKLWDSSIVPTLEEYVKIPNQSPYFDTEWAQNGHLQKAADLLVQWVKDQKVPGLQLELVQLPNRTPLIFMELASNGGSKETVLMYGHLDKQPPLHGAWEAGLGPYIPVIKDGKLFGRGAADDGYSIFAAIASIQAIHHTKGHHARIVVMIEACEESGSPDLPYYVDHLSARIGTPTLIICLDSGCGNYDQFWMTTSLRGMLAAQVEVKLLKEGVHSGAASGIIPSTFRIFRQLLSRLEDENTGQIKPKELYVDIPQARIEQTKSCAEALGEMVWKEFPFLEGTHPVVSDKVELLLNRCWRPTVSVTGADGFPTIASAGNVLRPFSSFAVSIRLPPTLDAKAAAVFVKNLLEKDPPYGAHVSVNVGKAGKGWESPALAEWLEKSVHNASQTFYNKPANFLGEGGSIPFMGMLGEKFPQAQFAITGVLGPHSNAHGPNEFLHIPFAKRLTCCVANILEDHFQHFQK
eukprot:TRINITY_DN91_c0_g1_i1.p1 TRINITY_DN91_c0_g1~~TRINITY_DN91_c0_g1_i1.p1  ORF type:complete len:512 (+),score=170.57 TRINITY_DN91_c0_g1_i1:2-1537(+)